MMDERTSKESAPASPPAPAVRKPVETWAKQKSTIAWQFAAARAMRRWPEGFEATEAEFDAAIVEAAHIKLS
jgi:hypothetical protein